MLNKYSDDEIQKELERRKKRKSEKPVELASPDFTALRKCCQEYIDGFAKDGYAPKDQNQWIFEAAMEAVFGKDVWVYINSF